MKNFAYIGSKGSELFVNLCEGFSFTGRVKYPTFKSWNGLNGWIETAMERTSLPEDVIKVAMRSPEQDFEWLLSVPTETLQEMQEYSPFGNDCSLDDKKDWYTLKYGRCNFRWFCRNLRSLRRIGSVSLVRRANYIMYKYGLTLDQLMQVNSWEFISPAMIADAFKKQVIISSLAYYNIPIEQFSNKLSNHREFIGKENFYPYSLIEFVNMGYEPKRLLQELGIFVSKKDAHRFLHGSVLHLSETVGLYEAAILFFYPNIPTYWVDHIDMARMTPEDKWNILIPWVSRNVHKLAETRQAHGPAGEVRTVYMHQLIERLTVDMFPNGSKTAYRRVQECLDRLAQEEIRRHLEGNQELPVFPHKITDRRIKQITSSNALLKEGDTMHHCVGGYIDACLGERSYIFHISTGFSGDATSEVCPTEGGKWKIQQVLAS